MREVSGLMHAVNKSVTNPQWVLMVPYKLLKYVAFTERCANFQADT